MKAIPSCSGENQNNGFRSLLVPVMWQKEHLESESMTHNNSPSSLSEVV